MTTLETFKQMLLEADGVMHSYDDRYEDIIESEKYILETESMQVNDTNKFISIDEYGTIRTQGYKFKLVALNVIKPNKRKG